MKNIKITLLVAVMGIALSACDKDKATSYPVNIRMTDAPGPYEAVNIDLQEVIIKGNDDIEVVMDANTGIYNLLDLTNGTDVLIATGALEVDTLQQIRLVLGPDNTIVVDGETHELSTPSAEQSGLKLQVHQALEAGVQYEILIDFDANKSILRTGNGTYKLKPVLRTIQTAISGAIMGSITPVGTLATVTAASGSDSYSSNVAEDGNFLIKGLPEGTYSVTVGPELPLNPLTKDDIEVVTGSTKDAGTFDLQ